MIRKHIRPPASVKPKCTLLNDSEILQEVTCFLVDDLSELPDPPNAGGSHEAVGLQDGHPVLDVPHDDELPVGRGDVGAGAVPVHVQQSHLQRLFAKESQTHLLIPQDLLHRYQRVARLLLLRQLGHTSQDHKVAPAEAADHLGSGFARLALAVLRIRAHLFAGLFGLEAVLVATAASVHEGLALFEAVAVSPARLVGLAGPLEARQAAGSRQLPPTRQHAGFVRVEVVAVFVALTVGEGEAVVPLWFVVPGHALLSTVVCVRALETLLGWKRQVGVVSLRIPTFGLLPDHHQGKVGRHAPPDIFGRAGVNAGVLKLRVVYDKLADVGDHDVPLDVIGPHYGVLFALQLFLPRDLRMRLSRHFAQKAGRLAHKNRLLGEAAVYGGQLDVSGEGGLQGGGGA